MSDQSRASGASKASGESKISGASGIGRRSLLLGAAGLTGAQLGMPYVANAAAGEPIKIGMIWAKTGQIVDQAEYLAQGGMLALEQRNNMLLGRPAEIVWLDEPNPQGAQQNAEISSEGADPSYGFRAIVIEGVGAVWFLNDDRNWQEWLEDFLG